MEKVKGSKFIGVYQKKLKSGDIAYYYTLKINGKVKWVKVGTKNNGYRIEDAKNARAEKYNEVHNIVKRDTVKLGRMIQRVPTLDEIFNQYIEHNIAHKEKPKTFLDYKSSYNKRVSPHIGNLQIDTINSKNINDMFLIHKSSKTDSLSPKSLNTLREIIRSTYKFAIEQDLYDGKNPVDDTVMKYDVDNQREKYLEVEDIQLLLNHLKYEVQDENLYMCALMCLMTGARINVVCHIRISDIDLKAKTIKLFDEKAKSDKKYMGYIADKYFDTIKEHIAKITDNPKSDLYILHNNRDLKDRKKYYQRRLKPVLDELFNKDIDPKDRKERVVVHTLRHTFGSQLANNGVDIYTIKNLMNHSDIKMTMRYSKQGDDIKMKGVNSFNF